MAQIDCKDCKKHSYNLRTGKRNEYEIDDGIMLPILRSGPPPCSECPKGSPERGEKLRLRYENHLMLDFYQRYKSVPGMRSKLLDCAVTQRNLMIITRAFDVAKSRIGVRARKRANRKYKNG